MAERPIRTKLEGLFASSRSSSKAKNTPRLFPQTAWISSTITCVIPRRISLARLVNIKWSDSGVVIRMSGGFRTNLARS